MVDNIQEMYRKAKEAFEVIEFWPQEKVDEMVAAVGYELQKEETAKALARLAVDESGMGVYEDKVAKVKHKVQGTLWDFKGIKTCGLVEEDKEKGIRRYAKPIGVVANVVPCTNPESTVCAVGLSLLKTRNAMIVSPHPRTMGSSNLAVEHGRKALRKIGAPEDLFQSIKEASHAKATELMQACDYAVATGGDALIRVVYEAGTPSQTVGAGNVVTIIDETADPAVAAKNVKTSKTANNAASCSSDNAVAIHESQFEKTIEALKNEGGYLCNTEEREKLRKTLWPDGTNLNRDIVAKSAMIIAKAAGIDVPEGTTMLMVFGEKIGPEDRFSGEKLTPVLTIWRWEDFDEIVARVKKIHKFCGEGHSVNIQTKLEDRMDKLAISCNVGRVVVNMAHTSANSGGWASGLPYTDTLGCGTWVGNTTSENVTWKHFLNYTLMAVPKKEYVPTEEDLFGDYLRKWGRD